MKVFLLGMAIAIVATVQSFAEIKKVDLMQIKDAKTLKSYIQNLSEESSNEEELFMLGVAYHNLALVEEKLDYSKKALDVINKAISLYKEKNKKDNSEYLLYLGSTYTLIGRDSKKIAQKVSNTNKGIALMDEAISLNSSNVLFRVVRAYNNVELPEMFGRVMKIEEDLLFIEKLQMNNEYSKELQELYYLLAKIDSNQITKQQRNAWLNKAYAFNKDSDLAKKIKKDL